MTVRATLTYFIFDRGRTIIVAQSTERLTEEEREVVGSIAGTRPILRVLK